MRCILLLIGLLLGTVPAAAEPLPIGLWLTQNHDGVIAITRCDANALCGRIVGMFIDRPSDPTPRDYRGLSQCHLALFTDARQVRPNLWKGHITDPRNGSVYGVELSQERNGTLALRGYLGIPLLGRTETWTRYDGRVPEDCRIMAPDNLSAMGRGAMERGPAR
jgi:uncharacterized protein (DUF2147 family)